MTQNRDPRPFAALQPPAEWKPFELAVVFGCMTPEKFIQYMGYAPAGWRRTEQVPHRSGSQSFRCKLLRMVRPVTVADIVSSFGGRDMPSELLLAFLQTYLHPDGHGSILVLDPIWEQRATGLLHIPGIELNSGHWEQRFFPAGSNDFYGEPYRLIIPSEDFPR